MVEMPLKQRALFLIALLFLPLAIHCKVLLGVDRFFQENQWEKLKGKRIGLITNHTGVASDLSPTWQLFYHHPEIKLVALFSPEHGFSGLQRAGEKVDTTSLQKIPVHSLYGKTRRPTKEMLQGVDVLVYDMQDIGCRSYTYISTLFMAMEEAAQDPKIPLIVLDRPNPLGGMIVEGPMLKPECRSFIGYINVPYRYGMTVGELATYFNEEYHIQCPLEVVRMTGWRREMHFGNTELTWIPTSPNIPEADTPFYYAATGILGELDIVSIGIGTPLPFKIIGAPWIQAEELCKQLELLHLPGVSFVPFHFRPLMGPYKGEDCHGALLRFTHPQMNKVVRVQYFLINTLKKLYPKEFQQRIQSISPEKRTFFCKVNGNTEMWDIIAHTTEFAWKLIEFQKNERATFLQKRSRYLFY